jgi:G protein-coupled receptor Mth (Methuselah protein)
VETVKFERKMLRTLAVLVIFCFRSSVAIKDSVRSIDLPCDFRETVNISSGYQDKQGNFHHDGTVYTKGSFAEYDYIVVNLKNDTVPAEPHIRGCICFFKPCFRVCCRGDERNCEKPKKLSFPTKENGKEDVDVVGGKYGVLLSVSCHEMYNLVPNEYKFDKWYFLVSFELKM